MGGQKQEVCDEIIPADTPPSAPQGPSEQVAWQQALQLWLAWNTAYEHVTEEAFRAGSDQQRLEDLMDQMDQVRQQALKLSRRLLERQ